MKVINDKLIINETSLINRFKNVNKRKREKVIDDFASKC